MIPRRLKRVLLLIALILGTTALTACGSDNSSYEPSGDTDRSDSVSASIFSCAYESRSSASGGGVSDSGTWKDGCVEVSDQAECTDETRSDRSCDSEGFCFGRFYRNVEFFEGTCEDRPEAVVQASDDEGAAEEALPPTTVAETTPTTEAQVPVMETVFVVDDTGVFGLGIPAAWTDIDTTPEVWSDGSSIARIVAGPVLEAFWGSYEGPGMVVYQLTAAQVGDGPIGEWIAQWSSTDVANCTVTSTGSDDNEAHVYMERCSTSGVNLAYFAIDSSDEAHRLLIILQWFEQHEAAYFDHFLESVVVY